MAENIDERIISLGGLRHYDDKLETQNDSKYVEKSKIGEGLSLDKNGILSATVDSELSNSSQNAVQNKTVTAAINKHTGDTTVHVTPNDKTNWNGKTTISEAAQVFSNPNLLINPDFRINQRGQTEYTSANYDGKYTLDRWILIAKHVSGTDGGIKIVDSGITRTETESCEVFQPLDDSLIRFIDGETCTISAVASNGELISKTFVCNASLPDQQEYVSGINDKWGITFYHWSGWYNNRPGVIISIKDPSITTNWVKLELGSVATPFVPPDPMVETLKCGSIDEEARQILLSDGCWGNIPSNPNLLINPDFRINQRGQTKYTSDNYDGEYALDRWALVSTNLIQKTNGIKITNTGITKTETDPIGQVSQRFPDELVRFIDGKTCTISAGASTGEIISKTFIYKSSLYDQAEIANSADGKWYVQFYHWVNYYGGRPCIMIIINDSSITVNWVKLELGSVATPFVPPDPATELMKCQRYYQTRNISEAVYLHNPEDKCYGARVYFSVEMRKKPALTINFDNKPGMRYTSANLNTHVTAEPSAWTNESANTSGFEALFYLPENVTPNGLDRVQFAYTADAEIN